MEIQDEKEEMQEESKHGLKDRVSGFGQYLIGEIETIGGVLTGDPITQAEGEYNVEVGTVRGEIEDDLEESEGDD
jgi:uncharacterized protein YjbJ (UPF0337 family)